MAQKRRVNDISSRNADPKVYGRLRECVSRRSCKRPLRPLVEGRRRAYTKGSKWAPKAPKKKPQNAMKRFRSADDRAKMIGYDPKQVEAVAERLPRDSLRFFRHSLSHVVRRGSRRLRLKAKGEGRTPYVHFPP